MAKFADIDEYFASLTETQAGAVRALIQAVQADNPNLELVLAWNQPMFRVGTKYLMGFMATKYYINLATVTDTVVTELASKLDGYRHGGRTISLPFDWQIDHQLLADVIAIRRSELGL